MEQRKRRRVLTQKPRGEYCRTCRARRVKCDLQRPTCGTCKKADKVCEGYAAVVLWDVTHDLSNNNDAPVPVESRALTPIRDPPFSRLQVDDKTKYAVEFFQLHTIPTMGPEPRWMQNALLQPALVYLLVLSILAHSAISRLTESRMAAIGAAHLECSRTTHTSLARYSQFHTSDMPLIFHTAGLSHLRTLVEELTSGTSNALEPVLLGCLLLMEFEAIQGHCLTAINHIRLGRRIIYERGASSNPMSAKLAGVGVDFITHSLANTSLHGGGKGNSGGESSMPYMNPPLSSPGRFTQLDEASAHLERLIEERRSIQALLMQAAQANIADLVRDGPNLNTSMQQCLMYSLSRVVAVDKQVQTRIDALFRGYTEWKAAFDELMGHCYRREFTGRTVQLLRIWFFVSYFTFAAMRQPQEAASDRFLSDFEEALDSIDRFQLGTERSLERRSWPNVPGQLGRQAGVFESGILSALFLICCKCRSSTRWRAAHNLEHARRTETIYTSESLALCAKTVIRLEENEARRLQGLSTLQNKLEAGDVPERARISDAIISRNMRNGIATVVAARIMHESHGSIELTEYQVKDHLDVFNTESNSHTTPLDQPSSIELQTCLQIPLSCVNNVDP